MLCLSIRATKRAECDGRHTNSEKISRSVNSFIFEVDGETPGLCWVPRSLQSEKHPKGIRLAYPGDASAYCEAGTLRVVSGLDEDLILGRIENPLHCRFVFDFLEGDHVGV